MIEKKSRICFRLPRNFKMTFQRGEGTEQFEARGTDLSTSGVGFWTDQTLEADEEIKVLFQLPSFKTRYAISSKVSRQINTQNGERLHLNTGVQFDPETPENILREISEFIIEQTNFTKIRISALAAGMILSAMTLVRCLDMVVYQYFLGTTAGKSWFTESVEGLPWMAYLSIQLPLGILLFVFAVGLFFYHATARRSLVLLSFLGVISQGIRLVHKADFMTKDGIFQGFYAAEILYLGLFIYLIIALSRKNFVLKFDSYMKNLESHLKF